MPHDTIATVISRNAAFRASEPARSVAIRRVRPVAFNPEGYRPRPLRVAIVHYWLVGMRGGEKVLEALCEMFPQADLFTHVYKPAQVSATIRRHRVTTTFIARLPFASRLYQRYLPLMPLALEQLDLREYDLVISSESGPAKGVLTRPETLHVCYCHAPMRYLWNMYQDYLGNAGRLTRAAMPWLAHRLRQWDHQSASRVDLFIANSHNVARRVRKYYGREAEVVHPPVDAAAFVPAGRAGAGDYYLCAGQLTRYKRVDVAVEAFNRLGRRLVVIGDGEEMQALRRRAGPTIDFLGRVDSASLRDAYTQCRAVVFPGEEDFGIVPLEAMASGRPIIAYGRGGALETVVPGRTGIFFHEQTPEDLAAAVHRFEAIEAEFEPQAIVSHARRFSKDEFKLRLGRVLDAALAEHAAYAAEATAGG